MKKLLLLISLFINFNIFSQEMNQRTIDSLKVEAVENFQKLYWITPIKHHGWVTDYEKLYSKDEIKIFNDLIEKFERETSSEIVIVTLDSLRATSANFDDLSLRIAQKWGIGKSGKDNGIVITISKHYRKIRIQNGNGIEKLLSDDETKLIIDNYFIPEFKNENYYSGTLNGVTELMKSVILIKRDTLI